MTEQTKADVLLNAMLFAKNQDSKLLDDVYDELKRLNEVEKEYKIFLSAIKTTFDSFGRSKKHES